MMRLKENGPALHLETWLPAALTDTAGPAEHRLTDLLRTWIDRAGRLVLLLRVVNGKLVYVWRLVMGLGFCIGLGFDCWGLNGLEAANHLERTIVVAVGKNLPRFRIE